MIQPVNNVAHNNNNRGVESNSRRVLVINASSFCSKLIEVFVEVGGVCSSKSVETECYLPTFSALYTNGGVVVVAQILSRKNSRL